MKNREIAHARQEVKIYKAYYQPSLNPMRFMKSIVALLVFGRSAVGTSYSSKRFTR